MKKLVLALMLIPCLSSTVCALDNTDDSWRKIDPALGIEANIRTPVSDPVSNAIFDGSREKEFILFELESEVCNVSFMGYCIWHGSDTWKRVAAVSSRGGVTTNAKLGCPARVVLTSWFKKDEQTWVQAKTKIIGYMPPAPSTPPNVKTIGVVAGFEDDGGGRGTVEFFYGCNP